MLFINVNSLPYSILISLLLLATSCTKEDALTPEITNPEPTGIYKYLALGDSYTIGESVLEAESFPYQLKSKLAKDSIFLDGKPRIIAKTGWSCNELATAITAANLANNSYDLVTLLVGVNDQYRNENIALYPETFRRLATTAIALADTPKRVIIISIPDYSVTPFGQYPDPKKTASELEAYNAINKTIAADLQIVYIDITAISRKAKSDLSYLAGDQLHPSGKMYGEWVEAMYAEALNAITK